eukprot:m.870296 g.870296  ORF g.870296 m.870296 type:complete len:136 (+) comp23565_c1_seq9:246-653(+)
MTCTTAVSQQTLCLCGFVCPRVGAWSWVLCVRCSAYVSLKHDADKVIVFERGNAVFAFNFHITNSYTDYRIGAPVAGSYSLLLCSDDEEFGGHARIAQGGKYFTTPDPWNNRPCSLQIYLPARTAIVLTPFNEDS